VVLVRSAWAKNRAHFVDVVPSSRKPHPDFDVTVENIPDCPAYLQKVKILATSGELPELFDADAEPYYEDIVEAVLVADIGEIFDEIGITDKFLHSTMSASTTAAFG
jgi:raffinose/stachyose/melibiose transport system substrate-binding protein